MCVGGAHVWDGVFVCAWEYTCVTCAWLPVRVFVSMCMLCAHTCDVSVHVCVCARDGRGRAGVVPPQLRASSGLAAPTPASLTGRRLC